MKTIIQYAIIMQSDIPYHISYYMEMFDTRQDAKDFSQKEMQNIIDKELDNNYKIDDNCIINTSNGDIYMKFTILEFYARF